jgi:hypothetical protein
MNEYGFGSRGSEKRSKHRHSENKGQCVLSAEEQLLQLISARAPLPELLNSICGALDCDIGNVVSLISLREDDRADGAAMARNARHFGLYPFCSAGVFVENDELLGSLEMYPCVPGSPSVEELSLIERATCLAAIAIERCNEAGDHENRRIRAHRPVPEYVLEWPILPGQAWRPARAAGLKMHS